MYIKEKENIMSLTKFNKDNLINIIKENDNLLTVEELLTIVNYAIKKIYFDIFWNNIKDDKDIYIDNEMIKYMGYSDVDINASKRCYLNILKENFKENIDYKLINNKEFNESTKCGMTHLENSNLNTHNKVKHLLVTPDCFKLSLMLLRTEKAKEIREYYVELEKIFKFYLEYQNEYQKYQLLLSEEKHEELEEKISYQDKLLQENANKNKVLQNNIIYKTPLLIKSGIYAATSKRKAKINEFKIGFTNSNPKGRITSFNITTTCEEDKYYLVYYHPVYDGRNTESYIHTYLNEFNIGKENFRINYEVMIKLLTYYCNNDNNNIYITNNFIKFYQDIYLNKKPIIPQLVNYYENDINNINYIKQNKNIFEENLNDFENEIINNYEINEDKIINNIENKISENIQEKIINNIENELNKNKLKTKIIDNIEYNIIKEKAKKDIINEINNSKLINPFIKSKVTNLIDNNKEIHNKEFELILNDNDNNLNTQCNQKINIDIPNIENKTSAHKFIDYLRDQLTKLPIERELILISNQFDATNFKKIYKDYCNKNKLEQLNFQLFKNTILKYNVIYLPSKQITYYLIEGFIYEENYIQFLKFINKKIKKKEYIGNPKILGDPFYKIYLNWCSNNKIIDIYSKPTFLTKILNNIGKASSRQINGRKVTYLLNTINI
jgi:MSV199 domain-containing protein/Meiotically Up-regulated Gene 113 (MUG113) protein